MKFVHTLGSLAASILLAGCAVSAPQDGPSVLTFPGKDKSAADFRQDQAICQQHAISHTGYGLPPETAARQSDSSPGGSAVAAPSAAAGAPTGEVSSTAGAEIPDEVGFAQCMAARGNTVVPTYDEQSEYAFRGNFGYGSNYLYAYPFYGAALVGGFGHSGFNQGHHHHGGAYHGGGHHGGWGGHGGGHGGWGGHGGGHGGWGGHRGGHGGGGHGGGHGGGGHGGGGH